MDGFPIQEKIHLFKACEIFLLAHEIDGVYLEFGCNSARTFRLALNTLGKYANPNKISHFYAFDSFRGMPEPKKIDQLKIFREGVLSTSVEKFRRICRRDLHRITITEGFYEDTLKSFELQENHNVAMAYIDCDYYSSTKTVLGFLKRYLRHGMIIGFDDWHLYYADNMRGQRKAFHEFRESVKRDFEFEKLASIMVGSCTFVVLDKKLIGSECK